MNKQEREVPLIYAFVYTKFKKHLRGSPFVKLKYLLEILKRICRIPKILHLPILKEMEKFGLIKQINYQKWEILSNKCSDKLKRYHFKSDRIPWN